MEEKRKETKKTIADELLEDNFFKPPIEDIIEETKPEKPQSGKTVEDHAAKEESLLFDDFLKSPDEATHETLFGEESSGISELPQSLAAKSQTAVTAAKPVVVARTTEPSSSKLKLIIASLGGIIVLLVAGIVYIYTHHVSETTRVNGIQGTQTIEIKPPQTVPSAPSAAGIQNGQKTGQAEHGTNVKEAASSQPAARQQPSQHPQEQVAANVHPAVQPQPVQEISQQFEVLLEKIKSKAALDDAKRIGARIDRSLKFDVTENKTTGTQYSLFVDKVYPSEGEATADNLKLMVANISNASVVKADGGYRILVGKYSAKNRAMTDIKNIQSAGLKDLLKEAPAVSSTYNMKVYPFKSDKEAKAYIARVRRIAAKITTVKVK